MNVFIFSTQLLRESGGIGNTTYYLTREFEKHFKVKVYVSELKSEDLCGVDIYRFSGKRPIVRLIKMFLHFVRHHNKKENNVIFCLTWRTAIPAYYISKILGVKYIVLTHGNDVLALPTGIISNIYSKLRKMVLLNANTICANSHYTAGLVKNIVQNNNIHIIHPCSGELALPNRKSVTNMTVLSIGRHEYRKGFQDVILALKVLVRKYPDLQYIIAGDGAYHEQLEIIARKNGVIDHCLFPGRISEQEKRNLLDSCSLLAMPSFLDSSSMSVEGFGIVFIEANAHGKPVVGTYSGGISDAVINGKTGLLVEERNVDQIAKAIDCLLSGEIEILEEDCLHWAQKHYYPNIAQKYIDLIKQINN